MIQILSLRIEEFRGIRALDVDFDGNSFVIYGPNGSGKSGVVDAIGFALTGRITRLEGPGTVGLTVGKHGPHVHKRDNPGAAKVMLTFRDTLTGEEGTLQRSVASPGSFTLSPNTPALRAAVSDMDQHPEVTLSRRELIKFILAEAGRRDQEVQALLQLDRLGNRRKVLKSATGKLAADLTSASSGETSARARLLSHFDQTQALLPEMLERVNKERAILDLPPIATLESSTDIREGLADLTPQNNFHKPTAIKDLESYAAWLADEDALIPAVVALTEALTELGADLSILETLNHRALLESGLTLVEDAHCPLCDEEWESAEGLRQHLEQKILRSTEASKLEKQVKAAGSALIVALRTGRELGKPVLGLAGSFAIAGQSTLTAWDERLVSAAAQVGSVAGALSYRELLEAGELTIPTALTAAVEELRSVVDSQPDDSAKKAAQTFLVVAAERWVALQHARAAREQAALIDALGREIYKTYCTAMDDLLASLYSQVEERFSHFYRTINNDDEGDFKAELSPSSGKLDLKVDFYGQGMFAPAAYHSEGHQDGMGVCLYLALVEKVMGTGFRFAVLDDVVMSVDSSHRHEFCKLLKTEFPAVQFIITTHDRVWAKQMQSVGLITRKSQLEFHGWTVNDGPAAEHGQDFWEKIEAELAKDDVPAAAAKLRRALESEHQDLGEALRARVAYRGDARYELGELASAVMGRHGDWLKAAKASANSWGDAERLQKVDARASARASAITGLGENWAVNLQVHYNGWAQMSKEDFKPVVEAWRSYLGLFRCDNTSCDSWIFVNGAPGEETDLRCGCGSYNLNLMKKS